MLFGSSILSPSFSTLRSSSVKGSDAPSASLVRTPSVQHHRLRQLHEMLHPQPGSPVHLTSRLPLTCITCHRIFTLSGNQREWTDREGLREQLHRRDTGGEVSFISGRWAGTVSVSWQRLLPCTTSWQPHRGHQAPFVLCRTGRWDETEVDWLSNSRLPREQQCYSRKQSWTMKLCFPTLLHTRIHYHM